MGTKRGASPTMNAHEREPCFQIHVHSVDGAGTRALATANAGITFDPHSSTFSLAECVCRTSFHTGSGVAAETDLCFEACAQTAGGADSDPAAMPREALMQESCASEGARVAPDASFHSGGAKYFHENLPHSGIECCMQIVGACYASRSG